MTKEEMTRVCDELHSHMDEEPAHSTKALAEALRALTQLRAAATWDYPLTLIAQIEAQMHSWFKLPEQRAATRQTLLGHIARLEDSWERPRS